MYILGYIYVMYPVSRMTGDVLGASKRGVGRLNEYKSVLHERQNSRCAMVGAVGKGVRGGGLSFKTT